MMSKLSDTNINGTRSTVQLQKPINSSTSTASAGLIRARSSTVQTSGFGNASTGTTQFSTLLNRYESDMSSSVHITMMPSLLNPPSEETGRKQKTSLWFWHKKNWPKSTAVSSVSMDKTSKGIASGDDKWIGNGEGGMSLASGTYNSKSSTLNSVVTTSDSAVKKKQPVIRSASTRETKSAAGFLRFLRNSFSLRVKDSPGTPPLSMTQSGLQSLAEKQASIAQVIVAPGSHLLGQICQRANGSRTFDSFDSKASKESLSSSDTSYQSTIGFCYSNGNPPPVANRNATRSHSAHARQFKVQSDKPEGGDQRAVNIYSNEAASRTESPLTRQSSIPYEAINGADRMIYTPIAGPHPTPYNCFCTNTYENSFQLMPRAFQTQSDSSHYYRCHFNATYSDGQIYDQPPPPSPPSKSPAECAEQHTHKHSSNHPQYFHGGPTHPTVHPVAPATAPALRRQFNKGNHEDENFSVDEKEEDESRNEKGGTLSRRRPDPPIAVLTDAHEKTPVPRGNGASRLVSPSHPLPNLPQPASKTKLSRRQTVGVSSPTSASVEPFQGSLHLKRVVRPDLEEERHRDTSLRITIHESKNLPPQRRFFCDICLDRKLYARTTSKLSKESVFWGECFDLNNLTELSFITINLYRQKESANNSSKRCKSSKSPNQLVAFLTIAISDLTSKYEAQHWHTMTPASMLPSTESLSLNPTSSRSSINQPISSLNTSESSPDAYAGLSSTKRSFSSVVPPSASLLTGRIRKLSKHSLSGSEIRMNSCLNGNISGSSAARLPQIRLAVKYQSIDVLPLHCYDDLRMLVVERSITLVQYLEPLLPTKRKEEIARCLVHIHEKALESNISEFLACLVDRELDSYDNLSLLLRSNSIASKAVECYVKLVGAEYLQKLLQDFVEVILDSDEDFEVDPSSLVGQSCFPVSDGGGSNPAPDADGSLLLRNQTALTNSVKVMWNRLQNSLSYFPGDLLETLASIRQTVEHRHGQDVGDQLVSGCLFLRCICPAIYCPTLFGLTNAIPDNPRVSRNLTLLAKVLQTIANFSHFEAKENYMRFMNSFVQSLQQEMHQFLRSVSTIDKGDRLGIWKKPKNNVSSCHNNIDLAYELTILYHHLSDILVEHREVSASFSDLASILATIEQSLSRQPLQRDTQDDKIINHTLVQSLSGLQIAPSEYTSPIYTSGSDFTSNCISPNGQHKCSFDLSSPSPEDRPCLQAFFGEGFETGADYPRGSDAESTEKRTSLSCPPVTGSAPRGAHQPSIGGRVRCLELQQTSASLNRYKQTKNQEIDSCNGISKTDTSHPTPAPQKWSSGPDLHADSPVVISFPPPPPPPALPQQQKDGRLGGNSTNIRMGTRAIRMSREGDLTGNSEADSSTRSRDDGRIDVHLSTVPVILQCEGAVINGGRTTTTTTATVRGGEVPKKAARHGSVNSMNSFKSSSTSSASSCLSMMLHAHANNIHSPNAIVNGADGQSVLVSENSHYFELPSSCFTPAMIQRENRNATSSAGNHSNHTNNDPALLSRVHRLLFGGSASQSNDYQNMRGLASPPLSETPDGKAGKEIAKNPDEVEDSQKLSNLQQRLRAMEEKLNQEQRDMKQSAASNMRILDRQKRCINALMEEINRLQSLRDTDGIGATTFHAP